MITVARYIAQSARSLSEAALDARFFTAIEASAELICRNLSVGAKLLVCGNGGSAADAQHIAGELVGTFQDWGRPGLPAIALTTDSSVLTAVANDFDFARVFARQVAALGRPGDVLLAISTSGESENVVRAAEQALVDSLCLITLTGADGGRLAALADLHGYPAIRAPSRSTPFIQQLHQVAYHAICAVVEDRMFGEK